MEAENANSAFNHMFHDGFTGRAIDQDL